MSTEPESRASSPPPRFSAWALATGIVLCVFAGAFTLLVSAGRIDSPEEFDMALRSAPSHAAPLAIASFFLALGVTRRLHLPLRLFCVLGVSAVVWVGGAQFLRSCYYGQLRARGVDPEQVLRSVRPQSRRLNNRVQAMPDCACVFFLSRGSGGPEKLWKNWRKDQNHKMHPLIIEDLRNRIFTIVNLFTPSEQRC